ncbi:MAG: bifunctional phosphoglucose/phosphomannose isomerase [bacterium]|nr:bifunctional phosphoglucose/phosphomannose isomerase [bacterium]
MTVLNDIEKIRATDPDNMYNRIFDLPEHLEDSIRIAKRWKFETDDFTDIKNIVVAGMGGSAIGGDLVRSFLRDKLQIPFEICRHYELPEYVDDESLVIISSYSGNTEETLSALDDALGRKAMLAAISTGGMLNEVSELNDIPLGMIPAGMQPRAALGYSFAMLVLFLEKIGLVNGAASNIELVADKLKGYRDSYIEDYPAEKNMAKKLAGRLHGKLPVIYSGPTLIDTVGVRWKGQICENSKMLAFANQFAEFNHNELVGWFKDTKEISPNLIVVVLRDLSDHAQIKARMDIVKDIIEELEVEVIDIYSRGDDPLERVFSLIQLGDFVSYYLAVLREVDPSPVDVIQTLKGKLAERK